jgi:hypothetical protein
MNQDYIIIHTDGGLLIHPLPADAKERHNTIYALVKNHNLTDQDAWVLRTSIEDDKPVIDTERHPLVWLPDFKRKQR